MIYIGRALCVESKYQKIDEVITVIEISEDKNKVHKAIIKQIIKDCNYFIRFLNEIYVSKNDGNNYWYEKPENIEQKIKKYKEYDPELDVIFQIDNLLERLNPVYQSNQEKEFETKFIDESVKIAFANGRYDDLSYYDGEYTKYDIIEKQML